VASGGSDREGRSPRERRLGGRPASALANAVGAPPFQSRGAKNADDVLATLAASLVLVRAMPARAGLAERIFITILHIGKRIA